MKIKVGQEEFQIDGKPITIICKAPTVSRDVEVPGAIPITPETARYHADRVEGLHPLTRELFSLVFPNPEETVFNLKTRGRHGSGYHQVLGLIDFSLKAIDKGWSIFWQHPETHLHPSAQLGLADVVVRLMKYAQEGRTK